VKVLHGHGLSCFGEGRAKSAGHNQVF